MSGTGQTQPAARRARVEKLKPCYPPSRPPLDDTERAEARSVAREWQQWAGSGEQLEAPPGSQKPDGGCLHPVSRRIGSRCALCGSAVKP